MSSVQHDQHVDSTADLDDTQQSPVRGRRAALRALALGSGVAVGTVAFGRSVSAGDSGGAQTDGNAVELGDSANTSDLPTGINFTPAAPVTAGPSAFSAGGYAPAADSPFPAGVGGYGDDTIPNGVHGSTTDGAGFGVVAASLADAAADDTVPAPTGLAVASANGPQIVFAALDGAVAGPTPGKHVAGELYRDADGTLWFTVPVDGDPDAVRFVNLAGSGSVGAFHPITPERAYDSRQPGYTVNGQLAPNTNRVVSVADGHDAGGTVTAADVVPEGATAVALNLTAASMTGPNFLAITPGDVTSTATSILNWNEGATQIANTVTVALDADRQVRVFCGDQTGSADFILDIFGYYI